MRPVGSLRPSQVITTYGPGAIVDLRNVSVLIAGLENWRPVEEDLVDEPRLVRALGKEVLYRPAYREDSGGYPTGTIPSHLFPKYLFCPNNGCRRLAPHGHFRWDEGKQKYFCQEPACPARGRSSALPSRFIVACPNGHLDDFPWFSYVHEGSVGDCKGPLKLFEFGASGSIYDINVKCEGCGKTRSMGHAFGDQRLPGSCPGKRPWLGQDDVDPTPCDQVPRPLLRGASNVYFPVVRSALSIPPWVNPIQEAVGKYERRMAKVNSLEKLKEFLNIGSYPELERFPPVEVWIALDKRRQHRVETVGSILHEEWDAFCHPDPGVGKAHFEIEPAEVPPSLQDWIARVVQARRLREVRAVMGFSRIEPLGEPGEDDLRTVKMVPLSRTPQNWLPAVQTLGEGIFVQFKETAVSRWEGQRQVREKSAAVAAIYKAWRKEKGLPDVAFPGMRYVLLHTISHALIRQLSLVCGYTASSLRERIYCGSDPSGPMAGILIYTAAADSDGSLGGLVELGDPRSFGPLFLDALKENSLCSSDPLCSGHQPETDRTLNGAACHACLMVSETSCERGNRLLDRNVAVATFAGLGLEFFPRHLYGGRG